jgi:two-component system alkaline phosphatase synthesis response regulator PhoP
MKRILVVEDDNSLSVLLRLIMKVQQDDWDVSSAATGLEALSQVEKFHPDLVLLDIMMPEMDGFEVCRKMKLDPVTRSIPVIFLTARTGQAHIELGLSLGAQGYITKPFDNEGLIDKIIEVTGNSTNTT